MTECIECGYDIQLNKPIQGEIASCPDCGVELEVVGVTPVRFDYAPEESEDWGE